VLALTNDDMMGWLQAFWGFGEDGRLADGSGFVFVHAGSELDIDSPGWSSVDDT
jgi:hypothetical protein